MKLRSGVLPQFQHVLIHGRWFTPSVVVLFLGLEMFGRQAKSDVHDTVGAVVLLLILAGISIRHRANPIPWVKKLGGLTWTLARVGDRFKVDVGPDFRGSPPLPRRLPFAIHLTGLGLAVWAGLAALTWWYLPAGWREPVVQATYTGYLALMSVLWGLLFVCALGGVYFPVMLMTRLSGADRPGEMKMTRGQLTFLAVYLVVTISAAAVVPLWPMLAFAGLCWLAVAVVNVFPPRPGAVQFLWRNPRTRVVRAVPVRRLLLAVMTLAVLLLTALIFSAAGGRVFGFPEETNSMPLTSVLGNWLGWLIPGLLISSLSFVFLAWKNDPGRPGPPRAHLEGAPAAEHRTLSALFQRRGWTVHFGQPDPSDARVRLVPSAESAAGEFDPEWPLAVSRSDLAAAPVYGRLSRRAEIQFRRQFLRGLEKVFHEAKARPVRGGCGYWLAPHLWFVAGLTRDEVQGGDEEPSFLTEVIGPPYAEVFALPVRRYIHQLLKALQTDLLFVEDGVGYRKLVRVLRVLFEVYDKGAGRKRAEDIHFRGLTNVRVIFHDFDIDEPFRQSAKYPEPKFAPLGRLRVMHVFKDRGADEERVEPPFEWDSTPVPSLVGV